MNTVLVYPGCDPGFDAAAVYLYRVDGTTWDVGCAIRGELATTIAEESFEFNEPVEGSLPSDNVRTLRVSVEHHKRLDNFESGDEFSDEDLIVETCMFTDEGLVSEEVMWTGPVSAMESDHRKVALNRRDPEPLHAPGHGCCHRLSPLRRRDRPLWIRLHRKRTLHLRGRGRQHQPDRSRKSRPR